MITGYCANGETVVPATAKLLAVLHPDFAGNDLTPKRERQFGHPWTLSVLLSFFSRWKAGSKSLLDTHV